MVEKWGSDFEFWMTALGAAVGYGSIWRLPYLINQHGGGAFLIPYTLILLIFGIPQYFLEFSIGQYFREVSRLTKLISNRIWSKFMKNQDLSSKESLLLSFLLEFSFLLTTSICLHILGFICSIAALFPCLGTPKIRKT